MSDSKDMHINESILSYEIREDLKKNRKCKGRIKSYSRR